jgi:hypothetical protein
MTEAKVHEADPIEGFISARKLSLGQESSRQADLVRKGAQRRASTAARHRLIETLRQPVKIDDAGLAQLRKHLRQAADAGKSELLVIRFPAGLCTDGGRAINNVEAGWEATLVGAPLGSLEVWREHLKPLGYGLHAQVIDWPEGMPGDIGLYYSWES